MKRLFVGETVKRTAKCVAAVLFLTEDDKRYLVDPVQGRGSERFKLQSLAYYSHKQQEGVIPFLRKEGNGPPPVTVTRNSVGVGVAVIC